MHTITFRISTEKRTCDRCEKPAAVWFSDDGLVLCRGHYKLLNRRRRQYRARREARAGHWGSAAACRGMHGYVPRFIGGPFDGQRADAGYRSRHAAPYGTPEYERRQYIEMHEYVQKPGINHYYHLSIAETCPIRWGEYIAGSLPAETSGVTSDTPQGAAPVDLRSE